MGRLDELHRVMMRHSSGAEDTRVQPNA
jgi:hypothetical protein